MKRKNWYCGNQDSEELTHENINRRKKATSHRAGNEIKVTTVIFVPNTPGGLLIRKLREKEDELSRLTGFKIKFQEAGGSKLANSFSTELARGKHCGRDPCPSCDSNVEERRPNCRSKNILYESICALCNPSDPPSIPHEDHPTPSSVNPVASREGIYIGESSRSLFERSIEHHNDAKTMSKKSHMVKHWMLTHPDSDTIPAFRFTIIAQYRDALSRQI